MQTEYFWIFYLSTCESVWIKNVPILVYIFIFVIYGFHVVSKTSIVSFAFYKLAIFVLLKIFISYQNKLIVGPYYERTILIERLNKGYCKAMPVVKLILGVYVGNAALLAI